MKINFYFILYSNIYEKIMKMLASEGQQRNLALFDEDTRNQSCSVTKIKI